MHEQDHKTADLSGMLPCVPNMPMVIKANIATELGICNGIRCTLSRIIMHPNQQPLDIASISGEECFINGSKTQPLMIIVKIKDPKIEQFVGLAIDELPIYSHTSTFDLIYSVEGNDH